MRPLRSALLLASTNPWLAERLPRRAFARRAVTRFMPGESLNDALAAARRLADQGFATIITQLGENVTDPGAATRVADHYEAAIEQIARQGLDCQLSVKPTHLGLDIDADLCRDAVERLALAAADQDSRIWLDMESSPYTTPSIALFRAVRERCHNVGLCLQANMRRTAADLQDLLPLLPSIRLVKGAYAEPVDLAYARIREVDDAYRAHARTLVGMLRTSSSPAVGIATHDVPLIRRIAADAEAAGVPRSAFEIQMLYGIRTRDQQQLLADGFRVRVLISYGSHWFPWYMRRLAERPANVWFMVRSMVAR